MPADDDELHRFCEQVRPRLVGSLSLQCADRGVAEELAQETLARVWERWAHVRELDSPEGWAYRVAMNLASSWFRRRAAERRAYRRQQPPPEAAATADGAASVALRQAVAALPRRRRTAVVLRYYLDLSVADSAAVMGCAPGTVKALVAQGLAALRAGELTVEGAEHE